MTSSRILSIGATLGFLGVALGALGAHALKPLLTDDQLGSFVTANRYHMLHSLLLVSIAFFTQSNKSKWLNFSAWTTMVGILMFSGSIYLLTTRHILGIPQLSVLGPITPIGGLFLMAGWVGLLLQGLKSVKN